MMDFDEIADIPYHVHEKKLEEKFQNDVISKFRLDVVGNFIVNTPILVKYGITLYEKSMYVPNKDPEFRKKTMMQLRKLGKLILRFKTLKLENKEEFSLFSLFTVDNLDEILKCVNEVTDGRNWMKVSYGYLIKSFANFIQFRCLFEPELCNPADFLEQINSNFKNYFGVSKFIEDRYQKNPYRKKCPAPQDEHDVAMVINYCLDNIKAILKEPSLQPSRFVKLRKLVVCRLSLANARHGGQPVRLTLKEWEDAEKRGWYCESNSFGENKYVDASTAYEVAFQNGARYSAIPVVIPSDSVRSVRILASKNMRELAHIPSSNNFIFASTKGSNYHSDLGTDMRSVCIAAGLKKSLSMARMKEDVKLSIEPVEEQEVYFSEIDVKFSPVLTEISAEYFKSKASERMVIKSEDSEWVNRNYDVKDSGSGSIDEPNTYKMECSSFTASDDEYVETSSGSTSSTMSC